MGWRERTAARTEGSEAGVSDEHPSLREYVDRETATIRREIAKLESTIKETADIHAKAHEREHLMTDNAINKAAEALTLRLEAMNEFRDQLTSERGTFPTKAELIEISKRIEGMIDRIDTRLEKTEAFVISSQAQLSTLRALMAVVLLGLAIAGFIVQQGR